MGTVLKELIYFHGVKVGMFLIIAPIAKDLIWNGAREWNFISIGIVGCVVQLVGIILLVLGGRDAR